MPLPINSLTVKGDSAKERYALLNDDAIVVEPLRLSQLWRATKTWTRAFEHDPYVEYLQDGVSPNSWTQRLALLTCLFLWHNNQIMFAAENAAALNIDIQFPAKPRSHIDKYKDKLVSRLSRTFTMKKTPEQKKRDAENREKLSACVKGSIRPERLPEMYQVAVMATDPDYQGRGLGSAVLQAMAAIADSEGRACWLISSNVANNAFYNSNGFFTAGSYYLGDQNPEWTKKPVLVQIMVREPKTKTELRQQPSEGARKVIVFTPSSSFKIEI